MPEECSREGHGADRRPKLQQRTPAPRLSSLHCLNLYCYPGPALNIEYTLNLAHLVAARLPARSPIRSS